MGKTPDYIRTSIDNYRKKFDFYQIRLPKGTMDRIKGRFGSESNAYLSSLILADLERLEQEERGELPNAVKAPEIERKGAREVTTESNEDLAKTKAITTPLKDIPGKAAEPETSLSERLAKIKERLGD